MWVVGGPGTPLGAMTVPPPWGGGSYNRAKSVAVGPMAAQLVRDGHAAAAATVVAVFGAPVGDSAAWLATVWLPRYRRMLSNLRAAHAAIPEAAVPAP